MFINLVESEPLCAAAETLLAGFTDTNHPSPVGRRMIILVLPITTVIILGRCMFVVFFLGR